MVIGLQPAGYDGSDYQLQEGRGLDAQWPHPWRWRRIKEVNGGEKRERKGGLAIQEARMRLSGFIIDKSVASITKLVS